MRVFTLVTNYYTRSQASRPGATWGLTRVKRSELKPGGQSESKVEEQAESGSWEIKQRTVREQVSGNSKAV